MITNQMLHVAVKQLITENPDSPTAAIGCLEGTMAGSALLSANLLDVMKAMTVRDLLVLMAEKKGGD